MATKVFHSVVNQAAKMYQKSMRRKLCGFGLKYEDLFFDDDPAVKEAIRRLTPEQKLARERRLFRAMDISLKRVPLPEHIQKAHDPFESYLEDKVKEVEAEREERELLNSR